MTAQNGLHNLPAPLRPAIRARDGHVFVRADLGQIEPRVLAVVSGDRAFAEATRSDDLYAPGGGQARRRPTDGQDRRPRRDVRPALRGRGRGPQGPRAGLPRGDGPARPHLRARGGSRAGPHLGRPADPARCGAARPTPSQDGARPSEPGPGTQATDGSRGRYARNAIIQGAAAELFKAWAATVRHAVRPLDGQIVLCLHDELLVHVPVERADEAVGGARPLLSSSPRASWAGTDQVRFVADTSVVRRWSEAKP